MAKKKKKKRVLKLKNIFIFLIIIILLVLAIYYLLTMPIKNIYIIGNDILTDEEIITESELSNYPSFLLTTSSKITQNLKKSKYIDKVKIRKKIGNVVEITITEYKVLAILEQENQIIMSSGEIIDNIKDITDSPILINSISEEIYDNFINKFSEVDKNILRQISQIEYSPVNVDDSRFLLYMNDGNLVYITLTKITKLNKYNSIKDKMDNKNGVIYLDSGDYIEFKDTKNNNE